MTVGLQSEPVRRKQNRSKFWFRLTCFDIELIDMLCECHCFEFSDWVRVEAESRVTCAPYRSPSVLCMERWANTIDVQETVQRTEYGHSLIISFGGCLIYVVERWETPQPSHRVSDGTSEIFTKCLLLYLNRCVLTWTSVREIFWEEHLRNNACVVLKIPLPK